MPPKKNGKSKGKKGKKGGKGRGGGAGGGGGRRQPAGQLPTDMDALPPWVVNPDLPVPYDPLTPEEKAELSEYFEGLDLDDIKGNQRHLLELVSGGHLDIERFDFGDKDESMHDLMLLVRRYRALTVRYPGVNRGSPSASSGNLRHRTYHILMGIDTYAELIESTKEHYREKWIATEELDPETQDVALSNAWVGKSLPADEHQALPELKDRAKGTGVFGKHYDNLKKVDPIDVKVRTVATIGDMPSPGKMMGFDKEWNNDMVWFPVPHRTIVGMDGHASGSDGQHWAHCIYNAANETRGTYTICFEIGIAPKETGDLPSCSNKGDAAIQAAQVEMWKKLWAAPDNEPVPGGGEGWHNEAEVREVAHHGLCTWEQAVQALHKAKEAPTSGYGVVFDAVMSFFPTLMTEDDAEEEETHAEDVVAESSSTDDAEEEEAPANAGEEGLEPMDIELVMSQAGCSRVEAVAALRENDNDLVKAIMSFD